MGAIWECLHSCRSRLEVPRGHDSPWAGPTAPGGDGFPEGRLRPEKVTAADDQSVPVTGPLTRAALRRDAAWRFVATLRATSQRR